MFSFQLATPKAQADLAEAITPFLNTAPVTPPVSGPSPAAPQPSSEGAALLAQPRAPMAQTLLAQHMQPMPSAPGLGNPAPAFSAQPQQQPQRFAVGGLASSLPSDPEDHANAQQFVDVRNQQLADMVAKPMRMAQGGLAVQPEKLTYDNMAAARKKG